MHTVALPKSVLCIELGPQWPMAHYELAYLIKKKKRLFFVPTSRILIPPSKLGKTRRRLARRLVGRQVCRLGAWGGGGGACMRNKPQLWALTQFIAVVANRVRMRRARHAYIGVVPRPHSKTIHLLPALERCKGPHFEGFRGESIGRAFSPTVHRVCGWCPRGCRAQGRSMILSLRGRRSVKPTMTIMEERFLMTKANAHSELPRGLAV